MARRITTVVIANPALMARLTEGGYAQTGTANRFERNHDGLTLAIDVLAPSYTGRLETNQRHGELVVDEVPGLAYALSRSAVEIELELRLTDEAPLRTTIAVPGPVAGLSLKALAYRSRYARSDAVDLWRLLEVAYAAGIRAADWPHTTTPMEAARCLHRFFNATPARLPDISPDAHVQTRIRALVAAVVGSPR